MDNANGCEQRGPPSITGYLHRKSTLGRWKKGFYVLYGATLEQYRTAARKKLRTQIVLDSYFVFDAVSLIQKKNVLAVVQRGYSTIFLRSPEEMFEKWLSALTNIAGGGNVTSLDLELFERAAIACNEGGIVLDINKEYTKLLGWEKCDLIGRNVILTMP